MNHFVRLPVSKLQFFFILQPLFYSSTFLFYFFFLFDNLNLELYQYIQFLLFNKKCWLKKMYKSSLLLNIC